MTPSGSPREEANLYSRVGKLEGRTDRMEEDISGLKGELDQVDGRVDSLEATRDFHKGEKAMLKLIFGGIMLTLLEQWHLISKLLHWIGL